MQTRLGARVELLTPTQLSARFPWINPEGVALGALGLENEGSFDPYLLLGALRKKVLHSLKLSLICKTFLKCLELGVRFVYGEVEGFDIGSRRRPEMGVITGMEGLPTDIRAALVIHLNLGALELLSTHHRSAPVTAICTLSAARTS
jgi:hypothetical protein